ncbi:MAG: hypothetical protein SGPRY_013339 [Prymnesium sp.]
MLAGAWEVGDDAGLKALAQAVEREQLEAAGAQRVDFHVQPARGKPFACFGLAGQTIRQLVEAGEGEGAATLGEHLECACSGVMACSTCHVYVHPAWWAAVGAPSEEEQDMIDLAHEPRPNSRLGCQLELRPELDGMTIILPSGANNM